VVCAEILAAKTMARKEKRYLIIIFKPMDKGTTL